MINELDKQNLPLEEADLKERIDGFNKEIVTLLGKYELGLAGMPKILPNGLVVADAIVVSVRKHSKKDETPKVDSGLENPEA